jgi:hypothetical protein
MLLPFVDSFLRVEIFLRAEGRLPMEQNDKITKRTLRKFIRKYDAGELEEGLVSLANLRRICEEGLE